MSGPIQSLAPGFLSLLGLKNAGQLPAVMQDFMQPVIDLSAFYFAGTRETIPVTAGQVITAVANYAFPELTVPQNEIWWVHGYNVQVQVAGTETWRGCATHYNRNTLPIHVSADINFTAPAAAGVAEVGIGGFFALGGDLFGVLTEASAGAGAKNGFGYLTISRFLA